MKILMWALMAILMSLMVVGCSGGVSQEDLDKINEYGDQMKDELAEMKDDFFSTPEPKQSDKIELSDNAPDEPYFQYSGSGDDVVSGLVTDIYSAMKVIHDGDGHFAIKAHYGDRYDLLINTTDPYIGGTTLLKPGREYVLEVTGTGDWEIQVFEIGTSSADAFSGCGDVVTPIFIASSDVYEIVAQGDGHFAVKGYRGDGTYDLLVNTTDTYAGTVMFKNKGDYSFFEIVGRREFTIAPK